MQRNNGTTYNTTYNINIHFIRETEGKGAQISTPQLFKYSEKKVPLIEDEGNRTTPKRT